MQAFVLLAFAFLQDGAAAAFDPHDAVVSRVIELARIDNRVQEHLDHLVNDIGPRLTSSSNLEEAEQWCRDQFREWGLDARLERFGAWDVGFDRGPWSGRMLVPEPPGPGSPVSPVSIGPVSITELVFITPAWSPGTNGPQRGRAVLLPRTLAELEALRPSLAGAWGVARRADERSGGPERGDDPERSAPDERRAVADLLPGTGLLGEIRRAGDELVHTSGNHRIEWSALPTRVTVRLLGTHYDQLRTVLDAGGEVELELDVANRFREGPIVLHNVVADLRGSELPDEYVIVGGHLDSWDGAAGACDNATGVSTTMEAARLLAAAGARPKRTLRFVLWSGEEQGLHGSNGYVRDHAAELPRVSAVFVHDEGTNYIAGLAGPAALVEDLRRACAPLFELAPEMPFRVRQNEGLAPGGSSDHAPFVQAGVPAFFWRQEGHADYSFVHHTQNDGFDAVVPEYQQHSAVVVAVSAYNTANLERLLDRTGLVRPEPFRRRMGVELEGAEITGLVDGGLAARAGWQTGDVILAIDGVPVGSRREIVEQLGSGGPVKRFALRHGSEELESTLDWTAEEAAHAARSAGGGPADAAEAGAPAVPAEGEAPLQRP